MEPIDAVNSQKTNETGLRSSKPGLRQNSVTAAGMGTSDPDQTKIETIAQDLDGRLKRLQHNLKIRVDKQTGRIIVKVVSKEDGKTIRQIPSEGLLKLVSRMDEMIGVMFDEKT